MAGEISYLYQAEGILRPGSEGAAEPADFLAKIIVYLTAFLDPSKILLISHDPDKVPWKEAVSKCKEILGTDGMPEIEMSAEFYENYIHGLAALTIHEQRYKA